MHFLRRKLIHAAAVFLLQPETDMSSTSMFFTEKEHVYFLRVLVLSKFRKKSCLIKSCANLSLLEELWTRNENCENWSRFEKVLPARLVESA